MPPKKSKKKAQAGNNRGFATTSVPAKAKEPTRPITPEVQTSIDTTPTIDVADVEAARCKAVEQENLLKRTTENSQIVDGGMKAFNRVVTDMDVDKRSRTSCIQISLAENHVASILRLALSDEGKSTTDQRNEIEDLQSLYTGEQLLRKLGLSEAVVQQVLLKAKDISKPEALLEHLVLFTDLNIDFENTNRRMVTSKWGLDNSQPVAPTVTTSSRMTELLSDEEDQDELEKDPNGFYIANQLELLTLQAQAKRTSTFDDSVARLKKRSRVIQNQLSFDAKSSNSEVRRVVKTGYLKRATIEARLACTEGTNQSANVNSEKASDSMSPPSDDQSSASPTSLSEVDGSDAKDILLAAGRPLSPMSSDTSEDIPSTLFAEEQSEGPAPGNGAATLPSVHSSQDCTQQTPFPFQLPKSSNNISPLKLLQTYMKRADKQAKEEFDPATISLTIRFSSAKVARRQVMIQETKFSFPDEETAKNYLCLKALFSVQELASEKAGSRFSGPFRSAWQLLEDEEEEVRKADIVLKVQNVRDILSMRSGSPKNPFSQTTKEQVISATDVDESVSTRHNFRDSSSDVIFQIWDRLRTSDSYASMLNYRRTLPIASYREALLSSIYNNQVTIVCGETGCGKSTQLPTFILEDAMSQMTSCKIYVTEPRRISAISLASRVSAELGENRRAISAGESLLGFSIRLDSQVSEKSRLIYATTGIVLRMLEENTDLGGITHLIIDEVHERSIESDFLLIVVKRLLRTRRDLRVVLMSATLQSERFNDYFGGHCSIFNVPGRTYPVEQLFLEDAIELSEYVCDDGSYYARRGSTPDGRNSWEVPDDQEDDSNAEEELVTYSDRTIRALKVLDPYKINFDLICLLLDHLEGHMERSLTQAILIFLPGIGEIRRLMDTLHAHKTFGDERMWIIYPLHSSIPNDQQQAAFDVPPRGVRKIVLATNIAETGITIPDITCVIDTGKHKESRFDARRQLNKLVETFIAKSNAKQRMGRAGRVQAGICFHLFSKARYDRMAEHQLPEFQRLNLDDLALRVKTVQLGGIEDVLLEALDAPTPENVKRSINRLIEVGALDDRQDLTSLGRHLAKLPVDITLGKLILLGVRYACLDPCLVIAASLSSKSPFESPIGKEREASNAKQLFIRAESDFITTWTAYNKWRAVCEENSRHEHKFCRNSFLSVKNLGAIEELRLQYLKILVESGLFPVSESDRRGIQRARFASSRDGFVSVPPFMSANNNIFPFVEACLTSAFYPNLINVQDGFRTIAKGQAVTIHPSSINYHRQTFSKRWINFFGLLKTKVATHAHDTGLVDDYIVALFCGTHVEVKPFSGTISIDHNRVKFMTRDLRTLMAVAFLRENLQKQFSAFLDCLPLNDEWLEVLQEIVSSFEAVAKQKLK
ncbi:protein of unknown function [Taphrina deformans PYCC 5710]|uniref:RNA helicase n=1 Tax=Taphrina deformans (strain PYCC 5710 / ATCC 11124 / CBS 356.35 / IMI 108563 / JCM 9778 / NBRC 8474) TaxID=1097556 RepID=R4XK70_TAPDE|nr:protein of unknown function [Taphrina deformans PYCC 5710]|eukprot:CCG83713.1 protein of unknown function [Taphrina deformans PYCC 5710]